MRMYLGLCHLYRIEIVENKAILMRVLRRKKPPLLLLDANHSSFKNDYNAAIRLVERIKQKYNSTRVVVLVGSRDENIGQILQQHGAACYVNRTIDNAELIQTIENVLQLKCLLRSIQLI